MKNVRYTLVFLMMFASSAYAQTGSWSKVTGFPGGVRDALESFTIGNKIYLGGGEGFKDFYSYEPATGTWSKKANLPGVGVARAFGVSFTIGDKGYVALGQDSNSQTAVLRDLWEYDTSTNIWTPKADFPFHRVDGAFAFVINGIAYVGGGADSVSQGWNEFFSYDPALDTWTALQPLPFGAVFFPASFVLGNFGYLATGTDSNLVWQYDPSTDSWSQLGDFPGPNREAAVSFVLNGTAYVGLGEDTFTNVFNDVYSYNQTSDTWTPIPSLNFHTKRGWSMAATVGDTAYVGFGFNFSAFYNDVWKFSPANAAVTELAPSDLPLAFPNPAHETLELSGRFDGNEAAISICNILGSKVRSFPTNSSSLDLSGLPPGIYNIEITSGEFRAEQRFVKE
jgi:N-acetylneuraminic acid mutarotase